MRWLLFIAFLSPFFYSLWAQKQEQILLNEWVKDDRFEKFNITQPVFLVENDTILTMDFEDLRPSRPVKIIKPNLNTIFGYGYIFFTGTNNSINPGYMSYLVADVYFSNPKLYLDKNNNFNFTDDGEPYTLPSRKDSIYIPICRTDIADACLMLKIKRQNVDAQPAYKKILNEYYLYMYKDRRFAGIDFSYREQAYICKAGTIRTTNDSFRVALCDGNRNGLYNEPDSDKIVTANFGDSIFDTRDDLKAFTISKKKLEMFVENQAEQFKVLEIDAAGKFIRIEPIPMKDITGKIKAGSKIPKFTFTQWNGEKQKIKQLKKHHVFIYFTGYSAKNFTRDTAILREIAALDPEHLKVLAFIDVNKTYELRIFGTYSNLNWIAAYKDKDISRMLYVRGLPSSLWIKPRRRLVQYNLSPSDFLNKYHSDFLNKK